MNHILRVKRKKLTAGDIDNVQIQAKKLELYSLSHSKDYKGIYFQKVKDDGGGTCVVLTKEGLWGVVDYDFNEIVPFGRYDWIDIYDKGLARVKIGSNIITKTKNGLFKHVVDGEIQEQEDGGIAIIPPEKTKWGIINRSGEEVLPVEYDSIWKFAGKNRESTMVEKDGKAWEVQLKDLNPELNILPFKVGKKLDEAILHTDTPPDYFEKDEIITPSNNPYYNDALDMDQQSPDFWENL